MRRTPQYALITALSLCAAQATAQAPDVESEHQRGVQLRAAGQNDEAAAVFRAIFERTGEPRALARLGLAEGALSRWTEADEHLQTALARASDPWISANRASLEQALSAVRGHLGTLTVSCAAPGATVQVGNAPAVPLPLQRPLRVTTGFVDLVVRAPGHRPSERRVAVPMGDDPIAVEVTLIPAAPVAAATPTAAVVATPPPQAVSSAPSPTVPATATLAPRQTEAAWQRPVGIGLIAGAGVALGIGVVGALIREGAAGRFNDGGCLLFPDRDVLSSGGAACRDHLSSVETGQTLGVAGFVTAGILGAAGITLFFLAPRAHSNVRVDLDLDPRGARGGVTLRF